MIELLVPRGLVLLSQLAMWEEVLLGRPVPRSAAELERLEAMELRHGLPRRRIRATWPRIFDLSSGSDELWGAVSERPFQACLPYIDRSWIVRSTRE